MGALAPSVVPQKGQLRRVSLSSVGTAARRALPTGRARQSPDLGSRSPRPP